MEILESLETSEHSYCSWSQEKASRKASLRQITKKLKQGDFFTLVGSSCRLRSPLENLQSILHFKFPGRQSSESQSNLSSEWTEGQLTSGPGEEEEEEEGYSGLDHSQGESLDDLRDWTGKTEKNNYCCCSVM